MSLQMCTFVGILPCGPAEGAMKIFSDLLSEGSLRLMFFCARGKGGATDSVKFLP